MTSIRTALATLFVALAVSPAAAGGFSFDLPRIDFPDDAQTTRGCATPTGEALACPGHDR